MSLPTWNLHRALTRSAIARIIMVNPRYAMRNPLQNGCGLSGSPPPVTMLVCVVRPLGTGVIACVTGTDTTDGLEVTVPLVGSTPPAVAEMSMDPLLTSVWVVT